MKNLFKKIKKFWDFMWNDDSILSFIVMIIFSIVAIKFLIMPILGFALGNEFPVVVIVTGSMEHKVVNGIVCDSRVEGGDRQLSFEGWWNYCSNYYENNFDLSKSDFENFRFNNGLNIGDVIILYGHGKNNIEVGDMLVFKPQDGGIFFERNGPVIHRVMEINFDEEGNRLFTTKGDHNPRHFPNFEIDIPQEDVIGRGIFRIPYIGHITLFFNKLFIR